ncbi:MAG: hypothetical protein M0017_05230 [Desulfobacteraceae bacterium]|nr:hypothetical protein [Desulfobacteraceae bacterium]
MECERLKKLLKTWYIQVQNEALAPARMVTFMKQHLAECKVCLLDPGVRHEVERITEIVLPPSKVRVAAPPREEEDLHTVQAEEEPEAEEETGDEERDEEEVVDEETEGRETEEDDDF